MAPVISTERLDLRPLETTDLDALAAVLGDPWTMRFYPAPFSRDEIADWIARYAAMASQGLGLHAIVLREEGVVIGDCGPAPMHLPDGRTEIELGWHIRRDHQGKGFATEAARAWLPQLTGAGVPRAISLIRPENIGSRRVAEKLGMTVRERILWNAELRWPHLVFVVDLADGARTSLR